MMETGRWLLTESVVCYDLGIFLWLTFSKIICFGVVHVEFQFSADLLKFPLPPDRFINPPLLSGNLQIDMDLYFVGFTCIFIKDSATVLYLEKKRDECIDFIVTKIQLCWKRRYINRKLGPHLRAVRETLAQADRTK